MRLRWRYLMAAFVLGLGLSLAVACGGDGDDGDKESRPAAATAAADETAVGDAQPEDVDGAEEPAAEDGTPEGGDEADGPPAPANAISDLTSYRYYIRVSLEGPPESEDADVPAFGSGPMTFDVEGAYVAPDRHRVKFAGKVMGLQLEEESIVIGDRTWVRTNGGWEERESSFAPDDFNPALLLADFDVERLSVLKPSKETINGVPSLRYKITSADIEELARLSSIFGDDEATQDVPQDFDIDLWLAEDGRWPVRMVLSGSSLADGKEVGYEVSMDVTDVNDEGIEIKPPE